MGLIMHGLLVYISLFPTKNQKVLISFNFVIQEIKESKKYSYQAIKQNE